MNKPPEIDVVIVNYNSGQALEQCIDDLTDDSGVDIKVVVVDNNSCDDSLGFIDNRVQSNMVPISVIRNPNNAGYSSACNQGAQSGHMSLIAFINPDCFINPQQLIQLSTQLQEHPSAALIGCRVLNEDGSLQAASRRRLPTFWRIIWHLTGLYKWRGFKGININDSGTCDAVKKVEAVNGACLLIKRDAFEQVGGFDEAFPLHFEDLDLFAKLQANQFNIIYAANVAVTHLKGHSTQDSQKIKAWKKQGLLRYLSKHRPRWEYRIAKFWLDH